MFPCPGQQWLAGGTAGGSAGCTASAGAYSGRESGGHGTAGGSPALAPGSQQPRPQGLCGCIWRHIAPRRPAQPHQRLCRTGQASDSYARLLPCPSTYQQNVLACICIRSRHMPSVSDSTSLQAKDMCLLPVAVLHVTIA